MSNKWFARHDKTIGYACFLFACMAWLSGVYAFVNQPVKEVYINCTFEVHHWKNNRTCVMTWGQGKYVFLGIHDFKENCEYYVKYKTSWTSDHSYSDLILIEMELLREW